MSCMMENSYDMNSNGFPRDRGLYGTKHHFYQAPGRLSLPCLDIRVLYIRFSKFSVGDSTPECLTLNHIPLSPDTMVEVNGVRCAMESEGIPCILRRDRVDEESEEATFVSTDIVRLSNSVRFEVVAKDSLLISGTLELSDCNGASVKWSMNCESAIDPGKCSLMKQSNGSGFSAPTIEVYVAGCFSGTPVILTRHLQVSHRKKQRNGALNTIPEHDYSEFYEDGASKHDLQAADYRDHKPESKDDDYDYWHWRVTEYQGEEGELSWFNAGVRVGLGLGLSICLGAGVGVGLLLRTYRTTTRTFKRRLWW